MTKDEMAEKINELKEEISDLKDEIRDQKETLEKVEDFATDLYRLF